MKSNPLSYFAIGVDYGSNSVRAVVVDVADGRELTVSVFAYPSGDDGILVDPKDPNVARQNPQDYIDGFISTVSQAVQAAAEFKGFTPDRVIGIGVDTTGSTPIPVDRDGMPLGIHPEFKNRLDAQAWLWRDHTSHAEAAEITKKAKQHPDHYLSKCGGVYSSEWYWAKILHCKRVAPDVFDAAYSWVELADFIPGYVTGKSKPEELPRGICAAGHKAMYHTQWGGLPAEDFLCSLDPDMVPLRSRFTPRAFTSEQKCGELTASIAEQVGLPRGVPVAVGALDAHHGAVGSGVKPGTLVKIMGTSTCDITVWPQSTEIADIPGVCGIVPGSVLAGMYGIEAGQSAVGDIFNWFARHLTPARFGSDSDAHTALTQEADKLRPGESGLIALDWNNGNRTVLVDPLLSGAIIGQTLHSTAAEVYRALVEATAFGALKIINRFEECGVKIEQVISCGGIAEKSTMVMQIYADVCNRPMMVSRSGQTCALGAAIFGSVVGGAHPDALTAQRAMVGVKDTVYTPKPERVSVYAELFSLYEQLHDAFGLPGQQSDLSHVMKRLISIRTRVRQG